MTERRSGRHRTTPGRWLPALAATLVIVAASGASAQTPAVTPEVAASIAPIPSPAPDALRIVTTTSVFADIVRNVAREHADVVSIIPNGVGPEDFEPTPAEARSLADTDLMVSNGLGLDDFLERLLGSGTGASVPRLVLGDGIPADLLEPDGNPHVWLDPSLVADHEIPAIVASLSGVDPAHATDFAANGAAYQAALLALDTELRAIVATIPEGDRKLVTFHDAYPYLARHFGFQLVGVILENVGSEPSAADLAALVQLVRAAGVTAVFSEAQFSPELAQALAQEAGVTQVVTDLYNDALGDPPADSYMGLLRTDIERIAEALR
jgi:ABC-type Zn uptake system ZnuABC Zn-binding protein ZnuA